MEYEGLKKFFLSGVWIHVRRWVLDDPKLRGCPLINRRNDVFSFFSHNRRTLVLPFSRTSCHTTQAIHVPPGKKENKATPVALLKIILSNRPAATISPAPFPGLAYIFTRSAIRCQQQIVTNSSTGVLTFL